MTRSLDAIFREQRITGLEFAVRLRDNEIGRKVLAEIDGSSSTAMPERGRSGSTIRKQVAEYERSNPEPAAARQCCSMQSIR